MQALSKRNDEPERASRPYDTARDGFVMGEGAGAVVLESEEHARARGARVYAELAGAGLTADAYHITAPDEEGRGAARALAEAMETGEFGPADVRHVNAHATSTPKGDAPEAGALRLATGGAVHLAEFLEQLRHVLRRDSDAGIGHREGDHQARAVEVLVLG